MHMYIGVDQSSRGRGACRTRRGASHWPTGPPRRACRAPRVDRDAAVEILPCPHKAHPHYALTPHTELHVEACKARYSLAHMGLHRLARTAIHRLAHTGLHRLARTAIHRLARMEHTRIGWTRDTLSRDMVLRRRRRKHGRRLRIRRLHRTNWRACCAGCVAGTHFHLPYSIPTPGFTFIFPLLWFFLLLK